MRNAISLAMWTELARVTQELGKTDSVRAIVYRGAGTVAFASGADISEFQEQRKDARAPRATTSRPGRPTRRFASAPSRRSR